MTEAFKMANENNSCLNICLDSKKFVLENFEPLNTKFHIEDYIFSFNKIENLNFNDFFDLDRLPPLNIDYDKLSKKFDNINFIDFINKINLFFSVWIDYFPKTEYDIKANISSKSFIRLNFYMYYIALKVLIMVSLHQNFNYSEATAICLTLFFDNIIKIKENFKSFLSFYKNGYLIKKKYNDNTSEKECEIFKLNKSSFDISNVYNFNNIFSNFRNLMQQNDRIAIENKMDIEAECSMTKKEDNLMDIEKDKSIVIKPEPELSKENNKNGNTEANKQLHIETSAQEKKEKELYLQKLSALSYNIDQTNSMKLFLDISNYYEMQKLSDGIYDPYAVFSYDFQLMPFIDFISNKEKFLNIIHNYQNFLLLIIMINVDEEQNGFRLTDIVYKFMPVFEIIYKVNEILQFVNNTEFYNDYINKNVDVNFQYECKNYLKYLKNENKSKFCWLRYFWIFDAKSKSEILCEFNNKTQREEFINEIQNMANPLFLNTRLINGYLIIEIKRNNMIEDSLNFLVNSQHNFKKQLKVKFIGEQGIDEGGVKKEYFLLLVRQLFNPEYGMFTYSEKTRFFWFNPLSFEAKIKFELIGIIFGLAFFNNVILDIKFPLVIYKKLLNTKPTLEDLKEIDEDLYRNFLFLLNTKEKNLKELIGTTFTATLDSFGEKKLIPLKVFKFYLFIYWFKNINITSLMVKIFSLMNIIDLNISSYIWIGSSINQSKNSLFHLKKGFTELVMTNYSM